MPSQDVLVQLSASEDWYAKEPYTTDKRALYHLQKSPVSPVTRGAGAGLLHSGTIKEAYITNKKEPYVTLKMRPSNTCGTQRLAHARAQTCARARAAAARGRYGQGARKQGA